MWCLSCFFVSASSHSPWLQAYFPYLQTRFGWFEHEDKKLFCLAARYAKELSISFVIYGILSISREFHSSLKEESQRSKFKETLEGAAQPGSPYSDLLHAL